MILKERFILGALIVVATLNYVATIATTTEQSIESVKETSPTLSAGPTKEDEKKEANRTENARSFDFDVSKYTSREFRNKVYDVQMPSHELSKVHTTFRTSALFQNAKAYENYYDVSTPASRHFDTRHKRIQNEIRKRLEEEEGEEENEELEEQVESHRNEPSPQRNNKTVMDIVRYSNVVADTDVRNKTSISRNYETDKGLSLSYENVYNATQVIGENEKAKRAFPNNATEEGRSGGRAEDEQTQQENNIAPVSVPLPTTTTSKTPTLPISTHMYELTDQEFVSTTESSFDAVSVPTEEFYEMTEYTMAYETTEKIDAEDVTTSLVTVHVVNGSKLEQVAGNAVIDERKPTDLPPLTTPVGEDTLPEVTSTEAYVQTSPITETSTIPDTTTSPYVSITEQTGTFSTATEQSLFTSEINTETTMLSLPLNNHSESTSAPPETTSNVPETTTAFLDMPTTTIGGPVSDSNAIIKDEEVPGPVAPATGTNEIKKNNVSVSEDFDDITDEATDDYTDMHRKEKPLISTTHKQSPVPITDIPAYQTTPSTTQVTAAETINDPRAYGPTSSEEDSDATSSTGETNNSGTIIAIALSTVGAICLILLAILLFVMRRRQKRFNYGQRCTPVSLDAYSMDNVSVYNSVRRKPAVRSSKRSYGNPAFDDDTTVAHPLNFQAIIRFANNADDIRAEFEQIPQVTAKMSELPDGCDMKNRYANVIPLPESRVFLTELNNDPTSDYINANYVTGPKRTRGYYIACQAPLHNTVNDFWRMIWEQQSRVILMLTHLYENGVEKCVDYLPPSEVVDCHRLFGDFQVTLKKREVKDKYIIASLQLKNMVSNSWREVTHLWYSGWPEKGVPEEANSIIAFLIEARSFIKLVQNVEAKENSVTSSTSLNGRGNQGDCSPVVVHCSPGTGRTGTVIACDIAIREFELRRVVDIPRIVYRIRRDRASSVQTKDQYSFIYKVISLYAIKLTGGALDSI